jgi:hypothetical protein
MGRSSLAVRAGAIFTFNHANKKHGTCRHSIEAHSKESTARIISDFESWLKKVKELTPDDYIELAARSRRALGVYNASFTWRGQGTKVRITSLSNDELRQLTTDFDSELQPALASSRGTR